MKTVLLRFTGLFLFISLSVVSFAQQLDFAHVISASLGDEATGVVTDNSGNVYVVGRFSGTVDFDFGSGIGNLTSNGSTDIFIAKYSSNGNYLWAHAIGGTDLDGAYNVKVDNANNVIVCGYFRGPNVDFNPGAGTLLLSSNGDAGTNSGFGGDAFLAKFTNSGGLLWAFNVGGDYSHDAFCDIDVDANNNIYTGGFFNVTSTFSTIDLDPGAGVYSINGASNGNGAVAKYTSAGNFVWGFTFGDYGIAGSLVSIKVDPNDTTFVFTGHMVSTNKDFDPGPGAYNLTTFYSDIVFAKFSLNKKLMWAMNIDGGSAQYYQDFGFNVVMDNNHNSFLSGFFGGPLADFNPIGAFPYYVGSNGLRDNFIAKYDKNGELVWHNQFGSAGEETNLSSDLKNNTLLVTGTFSNTIDLDPAASSSFVTSQGGTDIFIASYDTNGNFNCGFSVGGTNDETSYEIANNGTTSLFTTGYYLSNPIDLDPSVTSTNTPNVGGTDAYLARYSFPSDATNYNYAYQGDTICPGGIPTLTITTNPASTGMLTVNYQVGANSYTANNVVSGVPFPLSGTFTSSTQVIVNDISYSATLGCNTSVNPVNDTIDIKVLPSMNLQINASPLTVCAGDTVILSANGATSYSWSGGITNGTPFVPGITTQYTVTATDANGCSKSATYLMNVYPLPSLTAIAAPAVVCTGATTTLTGGGATSYSWTGGVTNGVPFPPTSAGTYTVTGSDANGCSNTASVTISLIPSPTVTANVNPPVVCEGNNAIFTGGGASSYTWTGGVNDGIPFTPAATSTYTVTGTSANGCTKTASITVNVSPAPLINATATPSAVCPGKSVILLASGGTNIVWTGGITNGVSFVPSASTTYTVTATGINGCTTTANVPVTVYPSPIISILPSNPLLCLGDSLQLTASGATTYFWSPQGSLSSATSSSPLAYPTSNTNYTITGIDANGCSAISNLFLQVIEEPKLTITQTGQLECGNKIVQLIASGADNYAWSPAAVLSTPFANSTQATLDSASWIYVVGTRGTCVVTDSIQVAMYNNAASAIFIPTAFSPNGDGKNDCFRTRSTARFSDYYLTIYNRWGQKVFESKSADDCWEGTIDSGPAMMGTYYYFLQAETACGKIVRKGDITLIR